MTPPLTDPKVTCPDGCWRGDWEDGYAAIIKNFDDIRVGAFRTETAIYYKDDHVNTLAVDLLDPRSREAFSIAMGARNGIPPATWDERLAKLYDHLQRAKTQTPAASPWAQAKTAEAFCLQDDQDLAATVKDVVIAGCITVVSAPRGSGKSFVALAIGVALAQGGIFRMERLAHQRVLLVDRDNAQDLVRRRLRDLGAAHLTAFKVLTRETAPPLTDKDAWAQFPAEDHDVLIVDSISAFTEGVSEKEGKQTQEFVATLKNLAARGLAILALANTNKAGTNIRGRGEQTDAVDIVYEARNITGWEPEDGPYWWENLPESGEQAWQQNTTRRLNGGALRIGFVPTKFRLGTIPAPFVLEMDTTTRPWTMTDVITTVTQEGIQAAQTKRTAERQKMDAAAWALATELRAYPPNVGMLKGDAVEFLRHQGLTRRQARNIVENGYNRDIHREGLWVLRENAGEKGRPLRVQSVDAALCSSTGEEEEGRNVNNKGNPHESTLRDFSISAASQPGDGRNAMHPAGSNRADSSETDFCRDAGSQRQKSTPMISAPIQGKTGMGVFLPSSDTPSASLCPQCGFQSWHQRLTYRECLHCQYKDAPTPREILDDGLAHGRNA